MAKQYERGEISVLELEDYCEIASKLIQYTPKEILFERVGASVMDDSLIAPMWSTKRWPCINEISRILEQNGAQGSMLGDPFVYVSPNVGEDLSKYK
jgi:radical SAM superfamily enzyme